MVDNASADDSRDGDRGVSRVKLLVNPPTWDLRLPSTWNPRKRRTVLLLNTDLLVVEGAIDAQIVFMEANSGYILGGLLVNGAGVPDNARSILSARTVLLRSSRTASESKQDFL